VRGIWGQLVKTEVALDDGALHIDTRVYSYFRLARIPLSEPSRQVGSKEVCRMYDLILKGGRIIDPSQSIDALLDIAFADGRVAALGPGLQAGTQTQIRDVGGLIVTPGLIDLHTHVYWGGTSLGVDAEELCRKSGVTTSIDAGSAGPGNFAGFRKHVIEPSKVRILAYIHVSHAGIFAFSRNVSVGESEDLRLMDPAGAVEIAAANSDLIVGIKVRVGRHASGDQGVTPLEYALQVADEAGVPLMAHIDEPPPSYEEALDRLRPGDVLTHAFRPFPNAPCTSQGTVKPAVLLARKRGVFFDIGHGMGSFAFKTARAMLANGFPPDTISSDVHALCINGPAYDLVTTMSKFLCLGMSLPAVVQAATENAARALKRLDLGTLKPGAPGDATVLSVEEGAFDYVDVVGEHLEGRHKINARATVIGGKWVPS
jgi:dihydroorotase